MLCNNNARTLLSLTESESMVLGWLEDSSGTGAPRGGECEISTGCEAASGEAGEGDSCDGKDSIGCEAALGGEIFDDVVVDGMFCEVGMFVVMLMVVNGLLVYVNWLD